MGKTRGLSGENKGEGEKDELKAREEVGKAKRIKCGESGRGNRNNGKRNTKGQRQGNNLEGM